MLRASSVYTGTDDAKTVTTTPDPGRRNLTQLPAHTPVDETAVKAVPRTPPAREEARSK